VTSYRTPPADWTEELRDHFGEPDWMGANSSDRRSELSTPQPSDQPMCELTEPGKMDTVIEQPRNPRS
jgi:hypothetical protein